MGWSKYTEDISDRYWDDQATMGRLALTFAPGTFEPTPVPQSGWIRLSLASGPLPDRIALVAGDSPELKVERDNPSAGYEVEFVAGPRQDLPEIVLSDGTVGFTVEHDGLYHLKVTCGAYWKEYEIDVSRTLDLDQQETIQKGYLYLQDRPDEWTRERLDALKRMMIPANRPEGIPDSFCNGILDYHLGLFHAEKDDPKIANQRFEAAYKYLRPFIAHSDVAHFICDYVQYLMNRFDGCEPGRTKGRFGGLRSFLKATSYESALSSGVEVPQTGSGRYIEVLVKSLDQQLLDVVREIQSSESGARTASLESLESRLQTGPHDVACQARVQIVLARGYRRAGNSEAAARHYRQLLQAGITSPWHPECSHFLSLCR